MVLTLWLTLIFFSLGSAKLNHTKNHGDEDVEDRTTVGGGGVCKADYGSTFNIDSKELTGTTSVTRESNRNSACTIVKLSELNHHRNGDVGLFPKLESIEDSRMELGNRQVSETGDADTSNVGTFPGNRTLKQLWAEVSRDAVKREPPLTPTLTHERGRNPWDKRRLRPVRRVDTPARPCLPEDIEFPYIPKYPYYLPGGRKIKHHNFNSNH